MESILSSLKQVVIGRAEEEGFDEELKIFANSTFVVLHQLGVGPEIPFEVTDNETKWSEFSEDPAILGLTKSYLILKVRLNFDPPANATLKQAFESQADEYEWRLKIQADPSTFKKE